jgi:bifunctional diaminopimelate decarboxylase / aspartate kinase
MVASTATQTANNRDWVVLKFGGTSISSTENWHAIANCISQCVQAGQRPMVVHSALVDVSNKLEHIVESGESPESTALLQEIRQQHGHLAESFGLDSEAVTGRLFAELTAEVSTLVSPTGKDPAAHARIVAYGELLATRLGVAILQSLGIDIHWLDAREILQSDANDKRSDLQNYVSATCSHQPDISLMQRFDGDSTIFLTQGFIASNADGETVLLGREGSDTTAAYLAAKLQAQRVEIWTDVPGIFSADPRLVPSARLLNAISYDEAQELASTGSKVLHPRCISPLRQQKIPLLVRCTSMPDMPGTCISAAADDIELHVKGVSLRAGITTISMQSATMWHEVGFLADAFGCFRKHGVSIGLVSTSETNVTVTIDAADDLAPNEVMQALVGDLQQLCRVRIIENCAVISLVGQKIRTILPRLAPALSVFEEEKIHLMSQAANDLNLSFVIDARQAQKLLVKLHSSIIRSDGGGVLFGNSWEQLTKGERADADVSSPWWMEQRDKLIRLADIESSAYVYDLNTLREAANGLKKMACLDRVLYAVKANTNGAVIRELAAQGVDFDCVSPGEVRELTRLLPKLDRTRILFTPNFAPRSDYEWGIRQGLQMTLDNLHPLQEWPELFDGQKLFIRIDPGKGRGHHDHVKTAGNQSKFGVPMFELDELQRLATAANATVTGLHAHTGSGILDPDNWNEVAEQLALAAERFPEVDVLDLGGGIGVPEKTGDEKFDLTYFEDLLNAFRSRHPRFKLWIEPGRFLVAQAGVLISKVTQLKGKGDFQYVGIGTGMNSFIRPALYGAYHEIVNLSRIDEEATQTVTVVGPICESGDKLGSDRLFPETAEGDVVLIANTGAYGRVMASQYNMRKVAPEIVI